MKIAQIVMAVFVAAVFAVSAQAEDGRITGANLSQLDAGKRVADILVAFGVSDPLKNHRAQSRPILPVEGFKCSDPAKSCCCMSQNSNTTQCMTEGECKGDAGPWAGGMCVGPIFPPGGVTDGCR